MSTELTGSATHAAFLFSLHVEEWWKQQAAVCRDTNMKPVWNTPQYKNAVGRELMTELKELVRRDPAMDRPAHVELQWGMPVHRVIEGKSRKVKLIMVPWKEQDHGDAGSADTGPAGTGPGEDMGEREGLRVPADHRRRSPRRRRET